MLSDDLDALAATFEVCDDGGVEFAPYAIRTFGRVLRDLARRAESMEAYIVPTHARLANDLPEGVVDIAAWLHANATRRGVAPAPKNGGDAA